LEKEEGMARIPKSDAIARIGEEGVIPLFFHEDAALAKHVADAIFSAGFSALEFTNRGPGALDVFAALSAHVRAHHPDVLLGVGTVHDAETAESFLRQGADFVVGAIFRADVAEACGKADVPYVPGCATPTEIVTAHEAGCELIKIFPADTLGGPAFLKAVKGPLPWLKAVASGGVKANADSLKGWFDAGVFAVCMGSDLIPAALLKARDFAGIAENAEKTRALLRTVRGL